MKKGQRVTLCGWPSKENDKYNPKEIEGTIVKTDGQYNPIWVLWDNGVRNSYYEKNLSLV